MADNGNRESQQSYFQTRRRFIEAAAVLSAGGIAGCSSNGNAGQPTSGNNSGGNGEINVSRQQGTSASTATDSNSSTQKESAPHGKIVDTTPQFAGQLTQPPTDMDFNPFSQTFESTANLTAYEQVGHFDLKKFIESGTVSYIPRACKWDFPQKPEKGEKVRITGNNDRTWHNGDPITANDIYTVYKLHGNQGAGFANFIDMESLKRVNKKTVEMMIAKKTNPDVLKINLLGSAYGFRFNTKYSIFKKYLQKIEDAQGNKKAMNKAQEKLIGFKLKKPVGTGWAKYKNRTPEKIVYQPHHNHPVGKTMEFETWTNNYASPKQSWQMALGGELDCVDGPPSNILTNLVNKEFSAFFHNFLSAQAIQFNQAKEPYGDPRVRKAFAWGINMQKAINPILHAGPWGKGRWIVEKPSGVMVNESAWLGDLQNSLSSYAPKSRNKDKVVELMQDAGYERSVDGKWAKDGKQLKVNIKHFGWPYIVAYMQAVKEDLQAMDFATQLSAPSESTLTTSITNGDYSVTSGFWGQGWHPSTSLDVMSADAGWMTTNPPKKVTVPPVGKPNSSSTTKINVYQTYDDMMTAGSYEASKKPIRKLAWIYNQTLPQIPVFNQKSLLGVDTKNFSFEGGIKKWNGKLLDGMFEMMNRGAFEVKYE